MKWQKPARIAIAVFVVGFIVVVMLGCAGPSVRRLKTAASSSPTRKRSPRSGRSRRAQLG
jgi:hypothetical protein